MSKTILVEVEFMAGLPDHVLTHIFSLYLEIVASQIT